MFSFIGKYTIDDVQAERIAVAYALRNLADHLEATAPQAAREAREVGGPQTTSFYEPKIAPTPTSVRVKAEKHEERWIAKVWIDA